MARRQNVEERLIALGRTTGDADSLRPYLADPAGAVVAKVARRIRDEAIGGLEAELLGALARCHSGDEKFDVNGTVYLTVLEALDAIECADAAPFRRAARHRRVVRSGADEVDLAAPVRVRGAGGLVRLRTDDVLVILTEHLADDYPVVQAGAARCLTTFGDPIGGHLARLRVLMGTKDPDVLTDCFTAMLVLDPTEEVVAEVFAAAKGSAAVRRRAALLALGESRAAGAFEVLRTRYDASAADADERALIVVALELLRSEASRDFLASISRC